MNCPSLIADSSYQNCLEQYLHWASDSTASISPRTPPPVTKIYNIFDVRFCIQTWMQRTMLIRLFTGAHTSRKYRLDTDNTPRTQYLENNCTCYLAIIANYHLPYSLLCGSTRLRTGPLVKFLLRKCGKCWRVRLSRVLLLSLDLLPTFTQRELVDVTPTVRDTSSSRLHWWYLTALMVSVRPIFSWRVRTSKDRHRSRQATDHIV